MIHRLLVTSLVSLAVTGCDEQVEPLQPTPNDTAANAVAPMPPTPTTQELVEGPRTQLRLTPLPLNATVPAGWTVVKHRGTGSMADVSIVEGYSPAGKVLISLSARPALSSGELKKLIDRVGVAKQPGNPAATVRDVGGMKVIETIKTNTATTDATSKSADDPDLVTWRVVFYPPEGPAYGCYEISFLDLNGVHFTADEAFLRVIVDSISADPMLRLH